MASDQEDVNHGTKDLAPKFSPLSLFSRLEVGQQNVIDNQRVEEADVGFLPLPRRGSLSWT